MIRSMTGFARTETHSDRGRLSWELRAVNHRYFDLTLRVPEDLRAIENDLRKRTQKVVTRGKVEASLRWSRDDAEAAPVVLDTARVKALHDAVVRIRAFEKFDVEPDPMRVLSWPGIVRPDERDLEPVQAAALDLFDATLAEFAASREREGGRMQEFIQERCGVILDRVRAVQDRLPAVRDGWLERLRTKITELGVEAEPGRLEQEAVLAAQKMDVDEELSRLAAHVEEVRAVLGRDEAIGRRLDFLMQELNREGNTLSSKSQDAEITGHAVEIKVAIEQMREQVQNIE